MGLPPSPPKLEEDVEPRPKTARRSRPPPPGSPRGRSCGRARDRAARQCGRGPTLIIAYGRRAYASPPVRAPAARTCPGTRLLR
eukprot:289989-Pleurochrysis_carterae.AAC.1